MFSGSRFENIISNENKKCALQLWALQIEKDGSVASEIIYGRILPYNISTNKWNVTPNDKFSTFDVFKAQVVRMSLYTENKVIREIIQKIKDGDTLSSISMELNIEYPINFMERFGKIKMLECGVRPPAYLINRSSPIKNGLTSTHDSASTISAGLFKLDKVSLLSLDNSINKRFIDHVVNFMVNDTGLDFSGKDLERFGEVEIMTFPALDSNERGLLICHWSEDKSKFNIYYDSFYLTNVSHFTFCLSIYNNGKIIHSVMQRENHYPSEQVISSFTIPEYVSDISDGVLIEVYADKTGSKESFLCCQYSIGYIRQIMVTGKMVTSQNDIQIKFDG